MKPIYDKIGINYSSQRQTDPRLAAQLHKELEGATKILNIGAGTGSYEPKNMDLIALEPSQEMINQRKPGSHPVVQGFADNLLFEKDSFSHTMTVLSMHHWQNRAKAFEEINRVTTDKFVAISWNSDINPFWLTRDYFTEIFEIDQDIFPDLEELHNHFDNVKITPLMIPEDCIDGFLAAYWKRPEAYLSEHVRNSISSFSKITRLDEGLQKLQKDLDSGEWQKKNSDLLDKTELDVGYQLITASIRRI
ncbi:MAG: methyltransferase domain-containing protein [bacterium]|nr:methyltransferase domain-containing protein [bacterium]